MKDAYIVSYAPQALEDLKGIYAYIAFELRHRSQERNW